MMITDDIKYVGVNDYKIDLFEGQYKVPNGISYNSYIIMDEKIAIMDTVDKNFKDEWLNNIKNELKDRIPDYIIIQHMEPDHSANLMELISVYPNICVVASQKAFAMIDNFFYKNNISNRLVVGENDTLSLGNHILTFITAPMVHWPEVIMTYDSLSKTIFSADAFGKFGALDTFDDWSIEARRYYIGIVGKYGVQVQALLKKASALELERICPLHGPTLDNNLDYYINLYNKWSSYSPEENGIVIAYTSIYGNTKSAVLTLAEKLKEKNQKVALYDLARCDKHEAIAEAFRYNKIIFATTVYNSGIFPAMREYIYDLVERNFSNRIVGFIENGSWGLVGTKVMMEMLSKCKNLTYLESTVKIKSAMNDNNIAEINNLVNELINM
ncbi:MAG: FprA family A-type flavoprotein [Anaeroplasma sp.]